MTKFSYEDILAINERICEREEELENITLEIASSGGSHIDINFLIPRIFKKEEIRN